MKKISYLIILFLLFITFSCSGYSKEQLEEDVKQSIIEDNDDPTIKVVEVNLIKIEDNLYEGYVNTLESGVDFQYNLSVVVDGNEFIWQIH